MPHVFEKGVGETIRPFSVQTQSGEAWKPADVVGRPLVMFFYLRDGGEACTTEACAFRDLYPRFQELGVAVVGVAVDSVEAHAAFASAHGLQFPLLADRDAKVSLEHGAARLERREGGKENEYAISLGRRTVFFGPDFRVVKSYDAIEDPAKHPVQVLEDVRAYLGRDEPRLIVRHAPVLLIPNVLPPEVCARMIEVWETQGNEDSGFMRQVEGKTVGMTDYSHKIRRDHFVRRGTETDGVLKKYVGQRVLPEIERTFNYRATRYEDFRIACYDAARGGYFRPHRDNTTDGTAHRRFAMSLLLNDAYEGGFLRFPEFGGHTYRPDAGSAVIFSCSLLHEATDVTSGRRFVLLSFLYGEAEARMREEYNRRVGGEYRA
jgi:peroxiredoxin/predicted 2-oxoglutarate/Fe(II)-dependent dioxygenase YbiX